MISIFAKPTFLNVNSSQPYVHSGQKPKRGHLMRVSSMIRGDQIADAIGAKFNPESGYENDICIYVKPHIKKDNMDFKFEGKKSYLDIVDGHNLGQLMIKYPEVGVIVCSRVDFETMSGVVPNKLTYIPQHHCNFKRERRTRNEMTRVGVIGEQGAFGFLPPDLKPELARRGMELVEFSKFFTRQDIIDFYLSIDVQIVWRPYKKLLSNPLKIVNASSFGVPTIALDEPAFQEVKKCYLPITNFSEFLINLDKLIDRPKLYESIKEDCIKKSEFYHIDNVGKMYKELDRP